MIPLSSLKPAGVAREVAGDLDERNPPWPAQGPAALLLLLEGPSVPQEGHGLPSVPTKTQRELDPFPPHQEENISKRFLFN